ncbi:hypothetical protein PS395_08700 [Limosilactobacillus pontis]|uniref:hypothetical protein n=1 Tax=Limosilactobacillus pontis TaxID=35787 RepID=UPI002F26CD2A
MGAIKFEEALKAKREKIPVSFMGDLYYVVDFKEYAKTVYVVRSSLGKRFEPIEIEPRYLSWRAK